MVEEEEAKRQVDKGNEEAAAAAPRAEVAEETAVAESDEE
jgi:small subunit ribosomal protein S2